MKLKHWVSLQFKSIQYNNWVVRYDNELSIVIFAIFGM